MFEKSTCECGCRREGVPGADIIIRGDFGRKSDAIMNDKTGSRPSGGLIVELVRVGLRKKWESCCLWLYEVVYLQTLLEAELLSLMIHNSNGH